MADSFDRRQTLDRLAAHLREANRLYPIAWRQFDQFRADREQLGDWPGWCYAPLSAAYAIVSSRHGVETLARHRRDAADTWSEYADARSPMLDISRLGALAAWRTTQGVYVIDPTILDAVIETPAAGTVPVEVLMTLPQWCVYVPTPGRRFGPIESNGFFAHIDWDTHRLEPELRILHDSVGMAPFYSLQAEILHLRPGLTLDASYELMLAEMRRQAVSAGTLSAEHDRVAELLRDTMRERVAPLVSVLLYLCCQTAEYRPDGWNSFKTPQNPDPTKIKGGWRLFPPDGPTVFFVGERLGRAIREARDAEDREHGGRAGPRPHVRRAHWHSYWYGARNSPARHIELRWLPPIPVALADDSPEARMRARRLKPIRDLDVEINLIKEEIHGGNDAPSGD